MREVHRRKKTNLKEKILNHIYENLKSYIIVIIIFIIGIVAGVIFNQVASSVHLNLLREACVDAGVECLGYLPIIDDFKLPSRHSGLTLTARRSIDEQINQIASLVDKYVNVDKLLSLCERIFPCQHILPYTSDSELENRPITNSKKLRIAIARDPAFCFLSRETIDSLSRNGQITYFSPVYGSDLPEADLVYIPGGYPELFARQLYRRKRLFGQLRNYIENGGKLLAECGGMLLLSHSITARRGGTAYEMADIFPFNFTVTDSRVCTGYRQMNYRKLMLRGYESHYTEQLVTSENLIPAASVYTMRGNTVPSSFYRHNNAYASLVRWYWGIRAGEKGGRGGKNPCGWPCFGNGSGKEGGSGREGRTGGMSRNILRNLL